MSKIASKKRSIFMVRFLLATPILAATNCGTGFDSPDMVKTLRVLAVQKDQPYAPPTTDPANPTQVKLTMLDVDGPPIFTDKAQDFINKPRPIQRLWFSGCDDLPGDQYFTCLAYMHQLWQYWKSYSSAPPEDVLKNGITWSPGDPGVFSDDEVVKIVSDIAKNVSGVPSPIPPDEARAILAKFRMGAGERYTYPVPLDIIKNHQHISGTNIPDYGLSFIFFTVCAGHVDDAPNWKGLDITTLTNATLGFPFICTDDKGNALGPDDFVAGYTQLFVYDVSVYGGTLNKNPVISGVTFQGNAVGADAGATVEADASAGVEADAGAGVEADAGAGAGAEADAGAAASTFIKDYCLDGDCVPLSAPKDQAPNPCKGNSSLQRVRACSGNCPTYEFSPTILPKDNNDEDEFAAKQGNQIGEQMWVDYYADRGTLKHTVRLLRDGSAGWSENDPTLGWSNDFSNTWTPPSNSGPVNLWAVAHDNRGGTAWVRLLICVD
jgi:hypothetical protein